MNQDAIRQTGEGLLARHADLRSLAARDDGGAAYLAVRTPNARLAG